MNKFIDYVYSFYGSGGIYDFGATKTNIKKAIAIRKRDKTIPFDADSVDRELIRDILLKGVKP
jgi:hypothetical protein